MEELLARTVGLPEQSLEPGQVLIQDGEPAVHLYVLVEGRLMVRKGDEDFIVIDAPGACVGEIAVLLGRNHTADVVAVDRSVVRVIEDAEATLDRNPEVLHGVATMLAYRLDLVNRYIADLQDQYRDVDGGLGMVGEVLRDLASHQGDAVETGSDRDPDALY